MVQTAKIFEFARGSRMRLTLFNRVSTQTVRNLRRMRGTSP
jgi:hypothetical protein